MLHLKQRKGASLAQLRKHLETNYEEKLNGSSKKLLTASLKGLVQTGKVKKLGNVYKLSGGKEDDNDDTTMRRRRKRRFPVGYCKTHRFPHRAGSRRRRSTRHRRRRHHRRRHHRRRHHRRRRHSRRHHRRRHHRRHSHRRHHRRHY
ncbi:unnamed protein product [Sphagnum compactum]